MEIRVDRQNPLPLFRQISQSIERQILQGSLPVGFRLPPERVLARSLGINRTTVMNAYAELKADNLIGGRVGDGTRVLGERARETPFATGVPPLRWSDLYRATTTAGDRELRDLLALSENRDAIILSLGFPALDLIPSVLLRTNLDEVLSEQGALPFFYGPAEGMTAFRGTLAEFMSTRGVTLKPDEIIVTSGSQQALDLVARMLIEPGDPVIVEEPTYLGALQVFRTAQARLLPVPLDAEGMRVDVLENLLARFQPKLIYTLPSFQNPSGAVMSLQRRTQLLELAYRFRVPVLEDDIYSDLWFDEPPPPSLLALDRNGFVLYASSFSKTLAPGLRVGWLAGPRAVIRRLVQIKQVSDLQAPTLSQLLLDRLIRARSYSTHAEEIRKQYAIRAKVMDQALRTHGKGWAVWDRPRGGFYVWCRLQPAVPVPAVVAAAAEMGVSVLPGQACFAQESRSSTLRLSFSYAKAEQIREGISRLARAVRKVRDRAPLRAETTEITGPLI